MSDETKQNDAVESPAAAQAEPERAATAPETAAQAEESRVEDSQVEDSPEPREAETHAEQEKSGGSIAGTLLTWLLLFLAGIGAALWGAPKVAPHLPASVARYVAPAGAKPDAEYQQALDARFSALDERVGAAEQAVGEAGAGAAGQGDEIAALRERADQALSAAKAAGDAAAQAQTQATQAQAQATQALEAVSAPRDQAAPVDQEARDAVSALDQKLAALSEALKSAGNGESDSALAARVAETEVALTALRGEMKAGLAAGNPSLAGQLSALAAQTDLIAKRPVASPERLDALATRIDDLAAKLDREAEARADMSDSVETARRSARAGAAFAELERAAMSGGGFSRSLAELTSLGVKAPEAVAKAADQGAPSYESLVASFPAAARAALDAASSAAADETSGVSSVFARLEARVTGLPREAQQGDSPAAVLSRARAAISARDVQAALAELKGLPDAAQAAMSDWSAGAQSRAALEAGLSEWRADIRAKL